MEDVSMRSQTCLASNAIVAANKQCGTQHSCPQSLPPWTDNQSFSDRLCSVTCLRSCLFYTSFRWHDASYLEGVSSLTKAACSCSISFSTHAKPPMRLRRSEDSFRKDRTSSQNVRCRILRLSRTVSYRQRPLDLQMWACQHCSFN